MIKRQIQQSNVCNSNECSFGTCEILTPFSYSCHCNTGITGRNCNIRTTNTNPCLTNPCFNNGICTNISNILFVCSCSSSANFGGPLCKGTLNSCQCQNGATCVTTNYNGANVNECRCLSGFGYF